MSSEMHAFSNANNVDASNATISNVHGNQTIVQQLYHSVGAKLYFYEDIAVMSIADLTYMKSRNDQLLFPKFSRS
jgi:hypothetical protein